MTKQKDETGSEIIIYEAGSGQPRIEVRVENETVWLTQDRIAELFGVKRPAITKHLKNIFESGELVEKEVSSILEHTTRHGAMKGKTQTARSKLYNLDAIISIGYRVNSATATRFRQWATLRLREYIVKGFTMDDERLKGAGGGNYWKELLDRIRDIRSSEKALYRQVLDLYATSMDYDAKAPETIEFFKVVQNKLHYATNQLTAAELIHSRADAGKDFMGLATFAGALPKRAEVVVAKNYLTEDELFRLNRMVSAFFDLAEIKAKEHQQMHMADWVEELDRFAGIYGKGVLENAGSVSHKQATEKALREYRTFQAKTLSPVEEAYLESIKAVQIKVEKNIKPAKQKPKREE